MRSFPSGPACAALVAAAVLAGCGPPPGAEPSPPAPLPDPTTPGAPGTTTTGPTPPPATSTTAADAAVSCNGQPGEAEVLGLLHDAGLLADGSDAAATEGPLCAGRWQFTVVTVPDRDPLQVVTSGTPDELTLVTAGTDVCSAEVRVHAPPGIQEAASCVG